MHSRIPSWPLQMQQYRSHLHSASPLSQIAQTTSAAILPPHLLYTSHCARDKPQVSPRFDRLELFPAPPRLYDFHPWT